MSDSVYMLGNLDGTHSALVAAKNQKEACRLMNCTIGSFRNYGGHRLPADHPFAAIAISSPGKVFKRDIVASLVKGCDREWK